jgi:DNA-binding MarR family transcriptional regulator
MTDTAADRSAVAAWHELTARHAAVRGALERELQERHGVGLSEFEALEWLAESGKDKCRAQELNEALPLSQSAASRVVARLERRELVTRSMCEDDRRGIFVCLTDAGHERYQAARPTHRAVLSQHL